MSIFSKITKAIVHPSKLVYLLSYKEFSGNIGNRSESDNGTYLKAVSRALKSYSKFSKFKRDPRYRAILEHTTKEQGEKYLEIIKKKNPQFLNGTNLSNLKKNDEIGSPIKHNYPDIGEISPTTLRYIKVASDLREFFGDNLGKHVVEIGCGYGGQMLVLDQLFKIHRYTMLDLPLVGQLISKFIESFTIRGSYRIMTLNQYQATKIDLVISNYAFSELPRNLQLMCIQKILAKSSKGYLTMNSGKGGPFDKSICNLSIAELEQALPRFEIFEEDPETAPFNYIIVWGHD